MSLTITWKDNADNETSQNVYLCDAVGGSRQLMTSVGPDVSVATITLPEDYPIPAFFYRHCHEQYCRIRSCFLPHQWRRL